VISMRVVAACSAGQHGQDCDETCDCRGSSCDPVTGRCDCAAGKTGESCQQGNSYLKPKVLSQVKSTFGHCLI